MFKLIAISAAAALWLAWAFAKLREAKAEPIGVALDRFGRMGRFSRVAVLLAVAGLTTFGGAKHGRPGTPAGRGENAASAPTSRITEEDYANGYVLYRTETNGTFDFSAPAGANVATNWLRRGAATDYLRIGFGDFAFPFRDLLATNAVVFADGSLRFAPGVVLRGFPARLSVAPLANWGLLDVTNRPSLFWWTADGCESMTFTWRNALVGRSPTNVVSCQVELKPDGNFTCRSGAVVRSFHRLAAEDRTDPDRDGDGLTTESEIFDHGTDPGLVDTDGDDVSDGEEVRLGGNPLSRDTDGDGYADATDPHPLVPDGREDADGDGLPDDWKNGWFGEDAAVSPADDPGHDGINNQNALLMGVGPLASGTDGFAETATPKPPNVNAWTVAPTAFSFAAPDGAGDLIVRTFAVNRTSPWQHLFVSSCPDRAQGWESADVAVEWTAGDRRGVIPASSSDSFRLPFGTNDLVSTVTFRIVATGPRPSLSRPLHLLRWTPRLGFRDTRTVSVFVSDDRRRVAVCPDPETGAYALPVELGLDGCPHRSGIDASVAASLSLPPVGGLRFADGVFSADAASWFDLPPEGLTPPTRLIFYRMVVNSSGEVASGPRASQYATPYPLDTRRLRKAFAENGAIQADDTFTVSVWPDLPEMGYRVVSRNARTPSAKAAAAEHAPPATVFTTCAGNDCTNSPPVHVEPSPPGRDPEPDDGEEEDDGCSCSADGTQFGSFRLRISLGEPAKDRIAGYLWTAITQPTLVSPSVFNILGTEKVTAVTNANGDVRIDCAEAYGSTVGVTNVPNGVDVAVRLSNGEPDCTWQIRNVDGDAATIRARRLTHLGNATVDEMYAIRTDDDGRVRWECTDNIRGVRRVKRETVDPADPAFVAEESEETYLGGSLVRRETRTYGRVGEGESAVRRLLSVEGEDERGSHFESRTYWCDAAHRYRHGRLRSVRSDRRAWAYHDYDEAGREVVRIEQLDGSLFPELDSVSPDAALPDWALAKVTVTDYAPRLGDADDRNDVDLPRLAATYVRTGGGAPVLVSRRERIYTRERDPNGLPLRRTTTVEGFGAATRTTVSVAYADDPAVPTALRGLETYAENEDGSSTATEYALTGGVVVAAARTSFGGVPRRTYEVTVRDASFGLPLRVETRLAANGVLVGWESRTYDDRRRLRSTAHSDGTSETNAYSCCRLLWRRDREGRKTLRSARTGTDSLYYADEDVWLGDVSDDGRHRVTQHFLDGFGRETNTVMYAASEAGAAADPVVPGAEQRLACRATAYHDEWGCDASTTVDERGAVVERMTYESEWQTERCTQTTAGDLNLYETTITRRGGRTETYRAWDDKWTRQVRSTGYAPDGNRVEYVVTESSDCGTVTNAVSVYDVLGRLVSTAVPGANGATLVTRNAYAGATTRMTSSTTTGSPSVTYGYNDTGEQTSTTQDGRSSVRETFYETIDGEVFRVVTTVRLTGTVTNSVRRQSEQLTGLSDALRSRRESVSSGFRTVTTSAFDPVSGLLTETAAVDNETPSVSVSYCGLVLSNVDRGESVLRFYDALGHEVGQVSMHPVTGEWLRTTETEYDVSGNATRQAVSSADGAVAISTATYDAFNRRTDVADALDRIETTSYDALGRPVLSTGDRHPVATSYDTAGRKTGSGTTRDDGATWDWTTWKYDSASGVNTAKQYADGSRIQYAYTDSGKRARTTWARGLWKQNAYNGRNLVSGVAYSDGTPSVAYAYDDSGKVVSAVIGNGTSYAYAYDSRLLCTNETVRRAGEEVALARTYDDRRREVRTDVMSDGIAHASKTRLYDSENRLCGYALTNVAGRGVSVAYMYDRDNVAEIGYTLPSGATFKTGLTRKPGREHLVARRDHSFNGNPIYWYATDYDVLGRPIDATDSISLAREWLYNRCSELAAATVGTNVYGYAYDSIGNRLTASANAITNAYSANSLNQYVSIRRGSTAPHELTYDADGNLTNDGSFVCVYDAENRLVSLTSAAETNGAIRVLNVYDHRNRRVRKTVQRLVDTVAAPPSPPIGTREWQTVETHDFTWDGMNVVLERIAFADGSTRTCEYFWGLDKSGTEQGAGGVEGLLAVSVDGRFYVPCYDHNGNVVCYVSETGSIAAQYVYDPYGSIAETYGDYADLFSFGFSTKYLDRETSMLAYQRRFYRPDLGRWINRDPIEEEGGENLYAFCENNAVYLMDPIGLSFKDDFIDSARIISGVGTAVLGASIGIAASWTGAGAIGGMGLFVLGVNQALGGLDSMISRAEGGPATDNSPIQRFYRSAAQSITSKNGSGLEIYLDNTYNAIELASSCYGGYVAVRTTVSAVRLVNVPARTVKTPIINNGYIQWTFELKAAYWELHGGDTAASQAIAIMFEGVSKMAHDDQEEN